MPSPGGQFLSDEYGDIEDYFISDYQLIDQYVGDTLWTWGSNSYGNLGRNTGTNSANPTTIFGGALNWKSIAGGRDHVVAIKTDSTLWTWGRNNFAQLGDNTTTNRSTPVTTFAGGTNWKSVACGDYHTAAIKTDGTLWTWGRNSYGQLGTNDTLGKTTPVTTFLGGNNWKSVACGDAWSVVIKTDGSLWIWGRNNNGQLGTNNTTNRSTPVTTFLGGNNWKSSAGGNNTTTTAAIKTDGTLWTWGNNNNGQLGIVNNTTRSTPVTTFAGGSNWKSVDIGEDYCVAIKTNGSLWTWGRNGNGQLGINDTTNRNTPVTTLVGGTNWKQVSCGSGHLGAIKTDGTLWVWGSNGDILGQLGDGSAGGGARSTPVTTIAGGTNWKSIANVWDTSVAIKAGLNVDFS